MSPKSLPLRLMGLLLFSMLLGSCQEIGLLPAINSNGSPSSAAQAPAQAATVTFTPFQVVSSTPTETVTPAPTIPPTATMTQTPTPQSCVETRGAIERMEIAFQPGSAPYAFRVYTPPCFDPNGETRYPVLYMIHGQTYNDDQWDRLGLDEAADALIVAQQAPPFLIVMPLEVNTFGDVYASSFSSGLVDGLVPWIDANYPTCASRDCRAIGGLSRGGAWSLRLGFTRWDLFGSVGLHSTPPFIGDPNQFPLWLREIPAEQVPRIYMDAGQNDYWIRSTLEFQTLLARLGVEHEWNQFSGNHDEEYWSSHVTDYLMWYTQPWMAME